MQKKKKLLRSARLRKLLRLHMVLIVLSLGAYFSVALFDPGFLSYDLRQKYHALADDIITVRATVLDVPVQPVVTGISQCNNTTGVLSVTLDWADDVNSYTYDIERDGLPLVSGLASSGYIDTVVALDTTYQYVVTARGPMGPGFATSVPVFVTTLAECNIILPAPTVNIVSFAGRNVSSYGGVPSVSDRQPMFTGTTNIPNATIQVVVGPISSLMAEFSANSAGYWEWRPPTLLALGLQTFTVTALDPSDSLRQVTSSLQFDITSQGGGSGGSKKKSGSHTTSGLVQAPVVQQAPVDFSLVVENSDATVLQGQDLRTVLKITHITDQYNGAQVPIRYSFVDRGGETVFSIMKKTVLRKGDEIRESLSVPLHLSVGEYSLRAEILFDQMNISRTVKFSVVELPLLQLGGGTTITYAEISRNIGWIVFLFIVLLLLWPLLFLREYWLYLHAVRHITEQHLRRAGFFSKRKGVVR